MMNKFIIGAWEITPDQNKLSLGAKDFFVEPLVMEVIVYFALSPAKVISVEELVDTVWKGRIVGDHAVYRVINQLRKTLSKDNGNAYISTIRKKGYKLTKDVTHLDPESPQVVLEKKSFTPPLNKNQHQKRKLGITAALICGPILVLLIWYKIVYIGEYRDFEAIEPFKQSLPFSVLPGKEKDAEFAPNGQHISYSHLAKDAKYFNIYVQAIIGESPIQITQSLGHDSSPSWSPDGKELVFVRRSDNGCQIMRINAFQANAIAEEVIKCHTKGLTNEVIWGNGDTIYFTDSLSDLEPSRIYKYSMKTSKKEQLTNPAGGKSKGDIRMSLSHAQDRLAFARDLNWADVQVMTLDLDTRETRELFKLKTWEKAVTWSFDDTLLYYIDDQDNINAYSIQHGFSKKVFGSNSSVVEVNSHKTVDKLTIVSGKTDVDIWGAYSGQEARPIVESSELDINPELSNTSMDIAFISNRSGQPQIWVKTENGREFQASQFTDGRAIRRLRWSPDDRQIVSSFENELYLIEVDTREYRVLWTTSRSSEIEAPNWSKDGASIYYSSTFNGEWQIYRKDISSNAAPTVVTQNGGYSPVLVDDNRMLYFKYHLDGIWMLSLDSNEETKLVEDTNVFSHDGLYTREQGFFYISIDEAGNQLKFFDFEQKQSREVMPMRNPFIDYTISQDGTLVLFPKLLSGESQIRVLEKKK